MANGPSKIISVFTLMESATGGLEVIAIESTGKIWKCRVEHRYPTGCQRSEWEKFNAS